MSNLAKKSDILQGGSITTTQSLLPAMISNSQEWVIDNVVIRHLHSAVVPVDSRSRRTVGCGALGRGSRWNRVFFQVFQQ